MDGKPGGKVTVLVTGFGPFSNYKINSSWELAKTLKTLDFDTLGIDLKIEEIPVVYATVSSDVPAFWKKYKPQLVVHMGVHKESNILVETVANKSGYIKPDILGKLPTKGSANGKMEVLSTRLNVQSIIEFVSNSTEYRVPLGVSNDCGRYLCEFIYYVSLNINPNRTVFIHVPDIGKGYSVIHMALIIRKIILMLLDQVNKIKDEEVYHDD